MKELSAKFKDLQDQYDNQMKKHEEDLRKVAEDNSLLDKKLQDMAESKEELSKNFKEAIEKNVELDNKF